MVDAAKPLPLILELHEQLQTDWHELRVRDGLEAANADPAFLAKVSAAWPKLFDAAMIHGTRADLPCDPRGIPCRCGGRHLVPLWASSAIVDGFRVDLYRSTGGRSAVACDDCLFAAPAVQDEAGVACPICDELGVVPYWVTNMLFGTPSLRWQQHSGATWFPTPCIACGGFGRMMAVNGHVIASTSSASVAAAVNANATAGAVAPVAAVPNMTPVVLQQAKTHELVRDGVAWRVTYGGITKAFEHRIGFQYLGYLLSAPDRYFHVRELVAYVRGNDTPAATENELLDAGLRIGRSGATDTVIDRVAMQAYRRRLKALDQELLEARENHDDARIERCEEEREVLLQEVAAATKPGGQLKKVSDDDEKARKSVRKAIAETIATIADGHGALAAHLNQRVVTGMECVYLASTDALWDVRL